MRVDILARLASAMYLRYFGLQEFPFSITPDPAYLFLSAYHREAFGHLLYGTGEHGGFVQLTGEVGTGKTTLLRSLVSQEIEDLDVALCLNPRLTVAEFLESICEDLGIPLPGDASLKTLVDRLNEHLLESHAAGRRTVLIIDEAQNLDRDVLEQVRLLTNLETHKHKLMRIILVGQPELEDLLRRPDLRQLAQRITARYHLRPLSRRQTAEYVRHRLEVAGGTGVLFTQPALWMVHQLSGGIPRLINTVCDRALMGAYSRGSRRVGFRTVYQAGRETLPARWPDGGAMRAAVARQMPTIAVALFIAAVVTVFGVRGGAEWSQGLATLSQALPGFAGAHDRGSVKTTDEKRSPTESAANETLDGADSNPERVHAKASSTQSESSDEAVSPPAELSFPAQNADVTQLLRLWGQFDADANGCRELVVANLRCIWQRGSFEEILRHNRPALLELRKGERTRWVVLSGFDGRMAELVVGDGVQRWPRDRLARFWTGEYQVIWRLRTSAAIVRPGTVGQDVEWIRRRLAQAEGVDLELRAGQPSRVYDEALTEDVRRFQLLHGLEPDGIVGEHTMIALNNIAPAPNTPTLRPTTGEDG